MHWNCVGCCSSPVRFVRLIVSLFHSVLEETGMYTQAHMHAHSDCCCDLRKPRLPCVVLVLGSRFHVPLCPQGHFSDVCVCKGAGLVPGLQCALLPPHRTAAFPTTHQRDWGKWKGRGEACAKMKETTMSKPETNAEEKAGDRMRGGVADRGV